MRVDLAICGILYDLFLISRKMISFQPFEKRFGMWAWGSLFKKEEILAQSSKEAAK
jgi:hypothetical protein